MQESSKSLAGYAMREYDKNAFLKSAMLCIMENPELQKAIATPQGKISLFGALRYAAATGLSLNPQEGKSGIISYGDKIQYQVFKNGILDLAMQSGQVEFVTCDTVRENDFLEIEKTSDGDKFSFKPALSKRGNIIGFFAACKLKSGPSHCKWMTLDEMEDHRDKYSAMYKAKPERSPWSKSFEGMGLKTVIKALFRNLSISPDIDVAIGSDDKEESDLVNITPGFSSDDLKKELEKKSEGDKPTAKAEKQGSLL